MTFRAATAGELGGSCGAQSAFNANNTFVFQNAGSQCYLGTAPVGTNDVAIVVGANSPRVAVVWTAPQSGEFSFNMQFDGSSNAQYLNYSVVLVKPASTPITIADSGGSPIASTGTGYVGATLTGSTFTNLGDKVYVVFTSVAPAFSSVLRLSMLQFTVLGLSLIHI